MSIRFTKMHSLGNDFMVIDAMNQSVTLTSEQIKALAHRHTGVGFDQCLLLAPSFNSEVDFFYRIYNADGSEVGQCGNGARCLGRFIAHYHLSRKKHIRLATKTTTFDLKIDSHDVTVQFEAARFSPQQIPLDTKETQSTYPIELEHGQTVFIHALSVGNPHAVLCVEDVNRAEVGTLGKIISEHPFFPEQVNVGFMERCTSHSIKLRVYERGCGETLACGSGAVAAAIVARAFYQFDAHIQIQLPGGVLEVHCPDPHGRSELHGPVYLVYEGMLSTLPMIG